MKWSLKELRTMPLQQNKNKQTEETGLRQAVENPRQPLILLKHFKNPPR